MQKTTFWLLAVLAIGIGFMSGVSKWPTTTTAVAKQDDLGAGLPMSLGSPSRAPHHRQCLLKESQCLLKKIGPLERAFRSHH